MDVPEGYRVAFLDWLACAAGGAGEPAAIAAATAGDSLLERVAAAGTAGHVLDFDDTYLPGVAHLSAATAPAALVLGAERGASVEEALAAYAAGFEAMGAFARAAHPVLYDRGWHPTSVCGSLGAAVVASRLLELDAPAERSAAALSLLRASGMRSAFGSAGKSLQVGMASAAGVAAARIAAAGAEIGLETVATGSAGFSTAFGAAFRATEGAAPAIEENWIKAYPCCLQTHSSIEAAAQLRRDGGSGGGRVGIRVHPLSLQAASIEVPADGLEAKFSIPYLTAHTLLHGAPGLGSFAAVEPDAARLVARVEVRADRALGVSEAVLEVDGEEAARVQAARGSPGRPLDPAGREAKRRSLAGERLDGALEDPDRPLGELVGLIGRR
ncbi:MAG: MmgE/PrpD family protein [Solirubrobacterales bacterium]